MRTMLIDAPTESACLSDSDEELLARYREAGDRSAFAELVRRMSPLVYGTALRITRCGADAADVMQECFAHLARLRRPVEKSLAGYLYAMARSRSLDLVRSERRRRKRDGTMRPVEQTSQERLEILMALDDAVAGLAEEHRELIVRHYLRGESQATLAVAMKVNQGTVSRRVQSAMETLRGRLAEAGVSSAALGVLPEVLEMQTRAAVPDGLVERVTKLRGQTVKPTLIAAAVRAMVIGGLVWALPNGQSTSAPASGMGENNVKTAELPNEANVIRNAPVLKWGIGQQCTHIGAMQVALEMMGEKVTYNELMGLSGAAFRLCFCQPRWDYSSVDGMLGYDHATVAMRSLGYAQAQISGSGNPNEAESRQIRAVICREIDAGRPVLGIDLVVCPEWAVVAGYESGGKTLLCRSYFDDEPKLSKTAEGYVRSDRWPWIRVIFGPKGKALAPREQLREAIKVAVSFDQEEQYITSGGGARYARGLTAYTVWANDLENEARFDTAEATGHDWSVNCFCYDALLDARLAAAEYLARHAENADEGARTEIGEAAALYGEIAQKLKAGRETCVPIYREDRKAEEWTAEQRGQEGQLLRECRVLEKAAIEHLRAALGKMKG